MQSASSKPPDATPPVTRAASGSDTLASSSSATPADKLSILSPGNTSTIIYPSSSRDSKSLEEDAGARHSKRTRRKVEATRVACQECREKRTKCDGRLPCDRCGSKDIVCRYAATTNKSKDELRQEVEDLHEDISLAQEAIKTLLNHVGGPQALEQLAQGQNVESIVASLLDRNVLAGAATATIMSSNDTPLTRPPKGSGLEPTAEATEQIALSLLHDQLGMADLPASWDWLESNYQLESTQQIADACTVQRLTGEQLATEPQQQVEHETGIGAEIGPNEFLSAQQGSQGINPAPGSWTAVTDDVELVHHLLALYFCWEYPTFVTLSREHFIYDFRTGSHKYCSPILVNALLAMACRFSSQRVGRGISDDPFSSGDLFFQESERLLEGALGQHSLPVVQALGIMSLRELSCGRQEAAKHLAGQAVRIAIEMGLHAPRETEHTPDDLLVMSATFWGIYALDNIWSIVVPAEPHSSKNLRLPQKRSLITTVDALIWIPYCDEGALSEHPCIQPAQTPTVFNCYCQLSELVHQASYRQQMHKPQSRTLDIVDTYTLYLTWYEGAPELAQVGKGSTPAVLFLHMYFHFAIVTLFWPVVGSELLGSGLAPRSLCIEAANAIQKLAHTFSRLYTLRRAPAFTSHILTTACIALVTISRDKERQTVPSTSATVGWMPESFSVSISHAIGSLSEMAIFQKGAQQELVTIQRLVRNASI